MTEPVLVKHYKSSLLRLWQSVADEQFPKDSMRGKRRRAFERLLSEIIRTRGTLRFSDNNPDSDLIREIFPGELPGLSDVKDLQAALKSNVRNVPANRIIGKSASIKKSLETASQIAQTDIPIFLSGETGVGKELFAEYIHRASRRSNGPFIVINCGALSSNLIASELFGHEPYAYTGADPRGKQGKLEAADGGTVFLDEIADLPSEGQAALLRFLDKGEIQKIGRSKPAYVNVRVISASNADLEEVCDAGKFRRDLYYRLALMTVPIAPLRERRNDIPLLADHFLHVARQKYNRRRPSSVSDTAIEKLTHFDWPGNVRQLMQVIERAFVTCIGDEISRENISLLHGKRTQSAIPSETENFLMRQLTSVRSSLFSDRERWVKFLTQSNGRELTNRDVVGEFAISEAGARMRLNALVELGILSASGTKKGRKYVFLPPASP